MNPVCRGLIERYSSTGAELERPRTLEELIEGVVRPEQFPQARSYLEARPALLGSLLRLVRRLDTAAHHHLKVAAYFKFKEREALHQTPLHGKEVDDWLAAEKEAPAEFEKVVNELTEQLDAELACAGSSVF
jgi:hypothetical protein